MTEKLIIHKTDLVAEPMCGVERKNQKRVMKSLSGAWLPEWMR